MPLKEDTQVDSTIHYLDEEMDKFDSACGNDDGHLSTCKKEVTCDKCLELVGSENAKYKVMVNDKLISTFNSKQAAVEYTDGYLDGLDGYNIGYVAKVIDQQFISFVYRKESLPL